MPVNQHNNPTWQSLKQHHRKCQTDTIEYQNVTTHRKHRPHVPIKNLRQYDWLTNNEATWQSLKQSQKDMPSRHATNVRF